MRDNHYSLNYCVPSTLHVLSCDHDFRDKEIEARGGKIHCPGMWKKQDLNTELSV